MPEISALPTATLPYDGSEVYPIVQAGETRKATLLPYKVYTALLTQTGTDAPVATVLDNTLGGTPVWSYSNTGEYLLTLAGFWTENKTWVSIENSFVASDVLTFSFYRLDADTLYLTTADGGGLLANGQMQNPTSIEIRVYS